VVLVLDRFFLSVTAHFQCGKYHEEDRRTNGSRVLEWWDTAPDKRQLSVPASLHLTFNRFHGFSQGNSLDYNIWEKATMMADEF
jgi:hypothetical protein